MKKSYTKHMEAEDIIQMTETIKELNIGLSIETSDI